GAVAVIAQIKHARESHGGKPGLLPAGSVARGVDEIRDSAAHRVTVDFARRHQSKHGPGGLRRRALLGRTLAIAPIRRPVFTPAAVRLLERLEPGHGAADMRRLGAVAEGVERAQHRPRAIDVVGAPAPEPGSVRLLLAKQEVNTGSHRRMAAVVA